MAELPLPPLDQCSCGSFPDQVERILTKDGLHGKKLRYAMATEYVDFRQG
jgi:hypothetical protein